jgi:hypothetical protein
MVRVSKALYKINYRYSAIISPVAFGNIFYKYMLIQAVNKSIWSKLKQPRKYFIPIS